MNHAVTPLRRALAAFATVAVLVAPVTPLAHARAMLHETMSDCSHPAAHHAMAPVVPQHSRHQHSSSCCDFCSACCQSVAMAAGVSASSAIAAAIAVDRAFVRLPRVRGRRATRLLPFSHAPPVLSA